jgi:predicted DNA-binding protein
MPRSISLPNDIEINLKNLANKTGKVKRVI